MLPRVSSEDPVKPWETLRIVGLAWMVKSGTGGATVVKTTLIEWDKPLMVPLIGRLNEFPGPGKAVPAKIESVAVPTPPALRITLVGLSVQLLHPG